MDIVVEDQRAVAAAILQDLLDAGALLDQNHRSRDLFNQLHGRGLADVSEVAAIMSAPRWTDQRASVSPEILADRGRLHRDRSLDIESVLASGQNLTIQPETITQLLADAYGSMGNWKPVSSAGRLWPLTLHVIRGGPFEIRWFDDDLCGLSHAIPGIETTMDEIAHCFVDQQNIARFCERGGTLVIVSADVSRSERKYGNRGLYYALVECGSVIQNIATAAGVAGLSTRPIGGFFPSRLAECLGLSLLPMLTVMVSAT